MLTRPTPWRTADTAYQAHHGACLWADYQAAGTPPHFLWLQHKQEATA